MCKLTVTNTDTGASIDVTVTDNCKVCGDSDVYLSTSAFEALNAGMLNGGTKHHLGLGSSSGSSSGISSSSVSVSSSSADSSSPTSVSVAKAIAPAPTSSASSIIASTSTLTSVASSTSSTASAAATGSSSNGWTLSQSLLSTSAHTPFQHATSSFTPTNPLLALIHALFMYNDLQGTNENY
ncbi:hypothetical protein BT96DRAFT_1027497 [Gymnopus androsaceus JB14]|uniref:RlpA-like protein double-psi beta-barrel domain-containing protein n=1 Tax=Gymnopus androsaceus JB14 TaxID=1447944 RepID=A0A6A4GBG4_9AGAR|nr:hypothetical protein BT96DRAFT_1027497 [Gymnopus androsaceus JB14]